MDSNWLKTTVFIGALVVATNVAAETIHYKHISSNTYHSLGVTTDGELMGLGYVQFFPSKLGNSGHLSLFTKLEFENFENTKWQSALASRYASFALAEDGSLWSWSSNGNCELGRGLDFSVSEAKSLTEIQVEGVEGWKFVTSSASSEINYVSTVFAISQDGHLWAWGNNKFGLLGDGTQNEKCTPQPIASDYTFSMVSAGGFHAVAISDEGRLFGWGYNSSYRRPLGDLTPPERLAQPTMIGADKRWRDAVAGVNFTIAIDDQGDLYALGYEPNVLFGEQGTLLDLSLISDSGDWKQVEAGEYFVIAEKNDGTVWSWGLNQDGQLGLGDDVSRSAPAQIESLTSPKFLHATEANGYLIDQENVLWAWGENYNSRTGIGGNDDVLTPMSPSYLVNYKAAQLSAGHNAFMLIDVKGTAWGIGTNTWGELGTGDNLSTNIPKQASPKLWRTVSMGVDQTFAIDVSGKLFAWGNNDEYMIDGEQGSAGTFVNPWPQGHDLWQQVSVGYRHVVALRQDGTLWAKGDNTYGQLGIGSTRDQSEFVQVGTDNDWAEVSAFESSTIALKQDGSLWAWGRNHRGQLALTTSIYSSSSPIMTATGYDWATLAQSASAGHMLALKKDGTLWSWGNNYYGQLSRPDAGNSDSVPAQVGTKSDWVSVAVAGNTSFAIKADGSLYAWGENDVGQLANGIRGGQVDKATKVDTPVKFKAVAAGYKRAAAIATESNDVYFWGSIPDTSSKSWYKYVGVYTPSLLTYVDGDGDGVGDFGDRFPSDASEHNDYDRDGIGDNADEDDDADGFTDLYEIENGSDPLLANDGLEDIDQDGIPLLIEYLGGSFDNSAQSLPNRGIYTHFLFSDERELSRFTHNNWRISSTSDAHQSRSGYALETTDISDNQKSVLSLSAPMQQGYIAFSVKTSTETNADKFTFMLDDEIVEGTPLSGATDWTRFIIPVSAGVHELSWQYSKDDDFSALLDKVWLTDVILPLDLSGLDTDNDGMSDGWEYQYGFDPFDATDAKLDADEDGLSNAQEALKGTNPKLSDSDDDGMSDSYELANGFDPLDSQDATQDADGDGLYNVAEQSLGTDPNNSDTDGDKINDLNEVMNNTSPVDSRDFVANTHHYQFISDINRDGIDDLMFVDSSNPEQVQYTLLDGASLQTLMTTSYAHGFSQATYHLLSDKNGDGIHEIGVFGIKGNYDTDREYQLVVLDGQSGAVQGTWNWPIEISQAQFIELDDLSGDGVKDYAVLGRRGEKNNNHLFVKSGLANVKVNSYNWVNNWNQVQVVVIPDRDNDGINEVGLYGIHKRMGKGQIFIRNGAKPNAIVEIYNWNRLWKDNQFIQVQDIDEDGLDDFAQFGMRKDDGRYQMIVKKGRDKKGVIRTFSWSNVLDNVSIQVMRDRSGDGVRENAIFGVDNKTNQYKLWMNDGKAENTRLLTYSWSGDLYKPQVFDVGDYSQDGWAGVALIGYDLNNNSLKVSIKDGKPQKEYLSVTIPGLWEDVKFLSQDVNHDGVDDLLLIGQDQTSVNEMGYGRVRALALSGTDLQTIIYDSQM